MDRLTDTPDATPPDTPAAEPVPLSKAAAKIKAKADKKAAKFAAKGESYAANLARSAEKHKQKLAAKARMQKVREEFPDLKNDSLVKRSLAGVRRQLSVVWR